MESLIKLNAILRFHSSNFQNLHWNAAGEEFDDAHKDITTGYYELCEKYIDVTAEMIARLDGFALNFWEVSEMSEGQWTGVASDRLYSRTDICEIAAGLLEEINNCICECLSSAIMQDVENAGMKSTLEAMQDEFDIEDIFINTRRLATL